MPGLLLVNGALTVLRALLKLFVNPFPHVLLELSRALEEGTVNVLRLPDPSTPRARAGVALVMPVNCAVDA